MKNKHNSFFKNSTKRPSSQLKFKNPPSIKSNIKLYKTKFNSPDKEIESSSNTQKNSKNKNNNKNVNKHQFSYFNFLSPIFNIKKRKDLTNKNQTMRDNLILTSLNNISGINIPTREEKILPYEYNHKNNKGNITNSKFKEKKNIKKNYMNNISLANFLSMKKNKNKNSKKKSNKNKNKTPDNNIISKLNSEKRNNQRKKNYFLTSLRSKKNSSRGKSEKNRDREKDINNLMKKLNILNLKKLPKPYYNTKIECLSNNKTKYGMNHFIDYLKGANAFKYNKKNLINKNISISSLSNISFKKVINNNLNNLNNKNINNSNIITNKIANTPTNNFQKNSKLKINPNFFIIKNVSAIYPKKNNKKMNSIEHKKPKSINFGPMSYPCFNCFFNIINDNNNNNLKQKTNNITIDMNYYGRSKKKIIFFYDKNNNGNLSHKNKEKNENRKISNKSTNLTNNTNNNLISNYYININNNNNINTKTNSHKNGNINLIPEKSSKIICQSQRDLIPISKPIKKKNYTTKNSPTKILTQRLATENKTPRKIIRENKVNNITNSSFSKIIDYNYYKEESLQLSNYIKNYYKKNKKYPNTKINFYKYGRLIGQGAFGKVNIGLNVLSGRIVAVKSFIKDELKNSQNMSKILYETNLMRKLNHPNITKILETFEDDKFILIIMEYINGGNLFSFVKKRRKLSEKISKFLFRQIILGIQHIHSKKIVHRDIKLENILIDLNNKIKICDFGIGIMLESEDELIHDQCGTPMYMAPEIILNSKKGGYKGFPVDIWSAGIALYIMLSGTLPFSYKNNREKNEGDISGNGISLSNNNNYELQYSIINKNPKKIKKISPEARDLLNGLLNKDPTKRLTIDEILNHPWLKKDKKIKKYKLFTKAEQIMLEKNYIDYRIKGNEDLKESFSISNLNSNEKNIDYNKKNIKTKSSILAPYNTLIENESFRINENGEAEFDNGEKFNDFNNSKIKMENDIINVGHNVKQAFINFEFNNNGELDNGMIIQSKSRSNTFMNLSSEDESSEENGENTEDNLKEKNQEKIEKILEMEENLGYNKEYVKKCLEDNILCHATTVYYLLMNYGNF